MMKLEAIKVLNARLDRGWSQAEAAQKAGLSPVTYNRAENGSDIHPSTGKQIAEALELNLADIRVQSVDTEDRNA